MVVRFVCVVRVPLCARVSRVCPVCVPAPPGVILPGVCPGSPRCLFTGCVSRLPPVSFYRGRGREVSKTV